MRASTMFALIIAVLLGLGVAVGVKASGFLTPAEPKKEPPPPLVLVAATNLFEGACLQATDVKLRPIRSNEELEGLKKGDFLPPMTQAAVRRFARVSIPADVPIRKEFLEDIGAPPELRNRLARGFRAVHVTVQKDHCASGLIQVGDWVDVGLITSVEGPDVMGTTVGPDGTKKPWLATRTGVIARNVRVIAKRNDLWPKATPLGPTCPVCFTLETNPYRAALIEYAKEKGNLTLHPLSDQDKQRLEARRTELLNDREGTIPVSYSIPESAEFGEEDQRVADLLGGGHPVSEADLMRLFDLKVPPPPPPPVAPPPPPPPTTIAKISGIDHAGSHEFYPNGRPPAAFVPPPNALPAKEVFAYGPGGMRGVEGPGNRRNEGGPVGTIDVSYSAPRPTFSFRPPDAGPGCTGGRRKG